jgi:hypothetical protein
MESENVKTTEQKGWIFWFQSRVIETLWFGLSSWLLPGGVKGLVPLPLL